VDGSRLRLTVHAGGSAGGVAVSATVKDAGKEIKTVSGAPDTELSIDLPNPKLWLPDHPFLVENTTDYAAFYDALIDRVLDFKSNFGLSAAVCLQITDVDLECNGLLTYDRVMKPDVDKIRASNQKAIYRKLALSTLLPTSQKQSRS
jgi:hypothetical protein